MRVRSTELTGGQREPRTRRKHSFFTAFSDGHLEGDRYTTVLNVVSLVCILQALTDLLVRGSAHHHHRVSRHHRAHLLHRDPDFKVGSKTAKENCYKMTLVSSPLPSNLGFHLPLRRRLQIDALQCPLNIDLVMLQLRLQY